MYIHAFVQILMPLLIILGTLFVLGKIWYDNRKQRKTGKNKSAFLRTVQNESMDIAHEQVKLGW